MLRPHHRRLQEVAFDTDIEELGLCAFVRLAARHLLCGDDAANAALRIVKVAGLDCLRGTYDHAGRLEIDLDAMRAEVALGGSAGSGIDIERVVRTGLHARFTSDAAAAVEIDNAIVALEQRAGGANLDARRLVAMIAAHHAEVAAAVGEGALFYVLDPGAEDSDRDLVLILAGNGACMASDASVLVDNEAVTHARVPSWPCLVQGPQSLLRPTIDFRRRRILARIRRAPAIG